MDWKRGLGQVLRNVFKGAVASVGERDRDYQLCKSLFLFDSYILADCGIC